MTRGLMSTDDRIFQYGIGAVKTVLIHSKNAITYRLERLNEAGNWSAILERNFTPEQFIKFCGNLEREISRVEVGIDRIRDSIHVSIYLTGDDLSQVEETTEPRGSQ